jgi:TonB-linked SusC/RagA family outer membrane protein
MKNALLFICMLAIAFQAWAQDRVISGKVSSTEDGSALPGVNVVVKGTTTGTVTDSEGNYRLTVPPSGSSLIFSFIGLVTKEIAIGQNTVVDTDLSMDVTQLSEIVVTGAGVATDKRKLAISVESIDASKLPLAPSSSIDQALIGKIPGAQISSVDGTPGAAANILLRGINSIQGGTQPMILVDGIQVRATDLNSLDLSNIERTEVVQGAAAASIYGAQGANGVIQLFTKRGKAGHVAINFSSSFGLNEIINAGNLRKASLHGFATDASNNVIDAAGNPIQLGPEGTYYDQSPVWPRTITDPSVVVNKPYNANLKYYDHFAQLFRQAHSTINNLSVSGGNEKTDYSFSFSDTRQQSTIRKNGGVDRTNLTMNIGSELFKNFKIRSTTQLIYTNNSLNPFFGSGSNGVFNMLNVSPFFDLNHVNADGNYPFVLATQTVSVNGTNPNANFQYSFGENKKIDVIQNLNLNYTVNKFIELDVKYGLNFQQQNVKYVMKNQTLQENLNYDYFGGAIAINNGTDATGEIDKYYYTTTFQNLLSTAIFRTDFQKDFNIDFPLKTFTQISYDYRNNLFEQNQTYGYSLKTSTLFNEQQVASTQVLLDNKTPFITFGYLLNQKFEFGEVAGVSGGFRKDWSSAFGAGITPAIFPRADGFFRLSSLDFWKNSSIGGILSEFKIRSAYGEAGIQPGAFDRYPTFTGSNIGTNLGYYYASDQKNPNLKVERTREMEIGTDLNLNLLKGDFLSGLTASLTYWNRQSTDVIFDKDVPTSQGSTTLKNNAFTLQSHGVQLGLNVDMYTSNAFNWDLTANFGHQRSIISDIDGPNTIVLQASAGSTNLALKKGDPIGQIYGFKALHSVNDTRSNGSRYIDPANEGNYSVSSEGYLVNKATKRIQFGDETVSFGGPNPKFNASFINNFSYKRFLTFSIQFDWIKGSHLYNQTREWMYRDGIHSDYARPVTIDGETAAYASYHQSAYSDIFGSVNGGRNSTKDYFYEDASFVRLRNAAVGVDFAQVFSVKGFKKLQLLFTGRNLLTFTKYTGMDPEINSVATSINAGNNVYGNSAFERGIDSNSTPNNRTYQVTLNLGF